MLRRRARLVLVALLVLPSLACGARWTDEQSAEVLARGERVGSAFEPGAGGAGSSPRAGRAGDGGAVGPGAGATGDGPSAGSPIDGGTGNGGATPVPSEQAPAAGGAQPCAAPANAPGVTDTEINLGTISALSGPVPGLGSSAAAAVRSHVAYRNATGGVCGRQVVLKEGDDGTDNGRYRALVEELGPQVLGIAGGFTIGDVGGSDVVAAQGLPVVNGPSQDSVSDLPTVFDVFPEYEDRNGVIGKYRWLRENGATKVALVYIAVDQSRAEANLQRDLMKAAGIQVALQKELPLSTLSYDSAARAVANSGADYLWFVGDINAEAAMARAMLDTGYELRFAEYYNFAYATSFPELAGDAAAEGTVAFIRSLPNEETATNQELARFVEWMGRVAPGENLDNFAVDSWVSAKLFLDTLEALPGPITREAFIAALGATDTYDADGMFGPIRVGAELTNGCVVGLRYESGSWRRLVPDSGFLC